MKMDLYLYTKDRYLIVYKTVKENDEVHKDMKTMKPYIFIKL